MSSINKLGVRLSPYRTHEPVRSLTTLDLLFAEEIRNPNSKLPIQNLKIKGLLSFGEETEFNFGRLNILVGPNGSGKSNLIDCLRILRNSPFDIQKTFNDSGFEEWLYNGSEQRLGIANIEAIVNIPGISESIRHQIRLGPL